MKNGRMALTVTAANLEEMVTDLPTTIQYTSTPEVYKSFSLKSFSIRRSKPLPEITLCGWTHHPMMGEAISDSKDVT